MWGAMVRGKRKYEEYKWMQGVCVWVEEVRSQSEKVGEESMILDSSSALLKFLVGMTRESASR